MPDDDKRFPLTALTPFLPIESIVMIGSLRAEYKIYQRLKLEQWYALRMMSRAIMDAISGTVRAGRTIEDIEYSLLTYPM